MAPEKCSSCNKTYYFKPGDYCALAFVRCDLGACPTCYEKEKPNLSLSCMFNKNIFFCCLPCNEIIRKETKLDDKHKKKLVGKKATKEPASKTNVLEEPETITLDENSTVDDLVDVLDTLCVSSQSVIPDKVPEGRKQEEDHNKEKSTKENPANLPEGWKDKDSEKVKPSCHFYKRNICKYGISGKGCKFFHQKPCNKLLSHGTDKIYGCTNNNSCKYFHPSMCKHSLESRVCTNLNCGYFHVKGHQKNQTCE